MSRVVEGAPGMTRGVERASPLAWMLNPYLLILVGALLDTAGEVLLKKGADSVAGRGGVAAAMGFLPLLSAWTWIGIISYVTSLVSWLYVLRTVPLSIAFPLVNVVHVFVPLAAAIFLHEHVSLRRWMGILLIIVGVFAIVKPLVKAEEKL
jgi:undecaprenyl phosphate-alpha-L-ara4N flippase subunit ArnE